MEPGPATTGGTRRPGRSLGPGIAHRAGVTVGDHRGPQRSPDQVTSAWPVTRNVTWRFVAGPPGHPTWVFFLFSSRLGCLGSLAVSALLTLLLLLVFDVI